MTTEVGLPAARTEVGASGVDDGEPVEVMASLSPSRAMDFKACPLLYRYRVVDRLPEPISLAALRGTLVHAVLERLFDLPANERTPAQAVALLPEVWADVRPQADGLDGLFADEVAGQEGGSSLDRETESAWLATAEPLLDTYFDLEDPRRQRPAARELAIEVVLTDGLLLRGIIDRLDESSDGRLRVVDYKTGHAPPPDWEARAMFQLRFYALMLWHRTGVLPSVLRLMYLADGVILEYAPDEDDLRATERLVIALHEAIRQAHSTGRFDASPGRRCTWCSFADRCPSADPGALQQNSRGEPR